MSELSFCGDVLQKRPTSTTDDDVVPSKKVRVAHTGKDATRYKSSSHSSSSSRHKKSPSPSSPKVSSTTTPDSTVDSYKVTESTKVSKPTDAVPKPMEVDKVTEIVNAIEHSNKHHKENRIKPKKESKNSYIFNLYNTGIVNNYVQGGGGG